MADRSSASLFAMIFESLASGKPPTAEAIWAMTRGYDFSPYQMECDGALKKLGLLWVCACDGGTYNYGPAKSSNACDRCSAPRPA